MNGCVSDVMWDVMCDNMCDVLCVGVGEGDGVSVVVRWTEGCGKANWLIFCYFGDWWLDKQTLP